MSLCSLHWIDKGALWKKASAGQRGFQGLLIQQHLSNSMHAQHNILDTNATPILHAL